MSHLERVDACRAKSQICLCCGDCGVEQCAPSTSYHISRLYSCVADFISGTKDWLLADLNIVQEVEMPSTFVPIANDVMTYEVIATLLRAAGFAVYKRGTFMMILAYCFLWIKNGAAN